ncbi:NADH-quinone oxidoreductase subunit L [Rhodovibrio sodomensis]|uniref:NADH-quinone oxidoreductase subunit L n=1 Tax=Rhodovibrio sodomensis TaxID=1088 RepID=A0ABS1DEH3_9PROT|nr:NADH-quinone oxidoreductase subunit L [Rhodovibrio sodomensis]MBK1668284.1 NADH-quinone oxidoreductase subunit L [Rhodovibrio sodomensis]
MEVVAVFLPLIGAILAGLFARQLGDRGAQIATIAPMLLSALLSVIVFFDVAVAGNARTTELFTWIDSGSFELSWALRMDTLSAVMLAVVTVVSAMVHVYSVGYMEHDPSKPRFFAYLSLFTFFMLMLATADNFVQLFFGWEGVGVASYLLIGFWYDRPSANAAAIKAFLVNRVGDVGFALGIAAVFFLTGAATFDGAFAAAPEVADSSISFLGMQASALDVVGILLFIGAMGKSAQLGLHTWLPDAMEGPTPVSALIHAATMVTAGIFMLCRVSPILEYAPVAMSVITVVGGATAFFAATVGMAQNDIKRVIAYSTCSQLGYMMFAIGVSAYGAAIFHLMTHAFFKALLFLGAGSVIHAMHEEQDMRKMGGIWRTIPYTYAMMWIGSLALAGLPPFAGFFSKDIVLEAAWAADGGGGQFAFWMGILAAFMTAFYSWRLLFMTFHGQSRAPKKVLDHAHESPWVMLGPLVVLSIGAVLAGWIGYDAFVGDSRLAFWGQSIVQSDHDVIHAAHNVPLWVKLLPLVMAVSGIGLAYLMYMARPELPGRVVGAIKPVWRFVYNKWYFDELYAFLFVRPAGALGTFLWKGGDGAVIDGYGPDGLSALTGRLSRRTSRLQTGYLYHYAFVMLAGVVVFVTWYLVTQIG